MSPLSVQRLLKLHRYVCVHFLRVKMLDRFAFEVVSLMRDIIRDFMSSDPGANWDPGTEVKLELLK